MRERHKFFLLIWQQALKLSAIKRPKRNYKFQFVSNISMKFATLYCLLVVCLADKNTGSQEESHHLVKRQVNQSAFHIFIKLNIALNNN